ncbi:MAG: ABC transporter ATP-binding protein [Acidobacteriota bacterium]|nr:ABC transporter ATP-binding protein [Acidobacteriota bacterium]
MPELDYTVSISNVTFGYGSKSVIDNVSLNIKRGEIVALMGPSGCGKSTLLRLIAGLESPAEGIIRTYGIGAESKQEGLRFLFQDYDAYPWYTVFQNVQVGSGPKPHPSVAAVTEILEQVGLEDETSRYPGELSGGMRKRLGLARCMVRHPSLLLLDEPFSSLDVDARYSLYELVQRLWKETNCSVIMVTHDIHEAILLADSIVVSGPRPFNIKEVIAVPYEHPREENINATTSYIEIRQRLTNLLRYSMFKNIQTVKAQILELAREYEQIRSRMKSGDSRTRKMEIIATKMRTLGLAGYPLLNDFVNSVSPGERLAAITMLQIKPNPEYLDWLATQVSTEKPFIGYHAAIAILYAVRSLGKSHRQELELAIKKARGKLGESLSHTDRVSILDNAAKELSSHEET